MTDSVDPLAAPQRQWLEPREAEAVVASTSYIPENDYIKNGYSPIGRQQFEEDGTLILNRDGDPYMAGPDEHFCKRCVHYYDRLANEKLFDKGEWQMPCKGDKTWRGASITDEDLAQSGMDEEEIKQYRIGIDPVAWIEYEFNMRADWYQADMMRCSNLWKAARAGRRVGKTTVLCWDILYSCFFKDGYVQTKFEYLIICPYEAQVKKIFDNIEDFIGRSHNMRASVKAVRKSPYWEIEFYNGSVVRGFSSGRKTGARSDKIRGQDADAIGFDEIDYMADEDIEAIFAVLSSNQRVRMWMSTTPTGARSKFHTVCTDKRQGFKEFWFISKESPRWTPRAENFFKSMYSQSGYDREFNAEFGTPTEGVFRQSDLDSALRQYDYDQMQRHKDRIYILGVDWNKLTGTHLVVVEIDPKRKKGARAAVVDKQIIRPQEFTQIAGVEAVVLMDKKWGCDYVYVDEGYGATQVELLHRIDKQQPAAQLNYAKRLVAVNMSEKVEFRDPRNASLVVKKHAKPFMIDLLAGWISSGQLVLPAHEDTTVALIESELAYLEVGLVQQMREFRVEKYSPQGHPRYTQGYEHTLTALALAVMGFAVNFSEFNDYKPVSDMYVGLTPVGTDPDDLENRYPGKSLEQARKARRQEFQKLREELAPGRSTGTGSGQEEYTSEIVEFMQTMNGYKTKGKSGRNPLRSGFRGSPRRISP